MSLRISALETASSVQSENDTKNSKISYQFDPKGSSSIEYEARDSSLMQFSPYFWPSVLYVCMCPRITALR